MDEISLNFCRNLKLWFVKNYRGTQRAFAKKLGISDKQVSNIFAARRCGDETWRRSVADKIGIPYEQMIGWSTNEIGISDRDGKLLEQMLAAKSENNVVEMRHQAVVKQFENKELALSINENLREIERLKSERFQELATYIKHVMGEIKLSSGSDRRKTDHPDKVPRTGDRRRAG